MCTHEDKDGNLLCDLCNESVPFFEFTASKELTASEEVQITGSVPNKAWANATEFSSTEAFTLAKKYMPSINESDVLKAYDICINAGDTKFQPEDYNQKVTVKISDLELDASKTYAMLHIKNDGTHEILPIDKISNGEISFRAGSFSTYILITVGSQQITFDGENFKVFNTKGEEITAGTTIASGTNFNFVVMPDDEHGVVSITCTNAAGESVIEVSGGIRAKGGIIASVEEDLTITVTTALAPHITVQPVSKKVNTGSSATFTVTAENATTYQWQYRKDKDSEWSSYSSGSSNSLSVTGSYANNGYQYRCIIGNANFTNHERVISDVVMINVSQGAISPTQKIQYIDLNLGISKQPTSQRVVVGNQATFSITAGSGANKYQWMYKAPGAELWTNCDSSMSSGYSSNTLKVNTNKVKINSDDLTIENSMDGYEFKCVIWNSVIEQYKKESDVAMLTVVQGNVSEKIDFVDVIQPQDVKVTEGTEAKFTTGVTPAINGVKYEWHEVIGNTDTNLAENSTIYVSDIKGQSNATATETIVMKASENATVSFDYMVSSEENNDKFTVTIKDANGITTAVDGISGIKNWANYTGEFVADENGEIILTLTYSKNATKDEGADLGAIKNLKCTATKKIDGISTYVSDDVFTFTNPDTSSYSSAKVWSATEIDGVLTFQSTNAGVGSSYSVASILIKNIPASGATLSFEYRVSSESASYDYFQANLLPTINSSTTGQLFKIGGTGTVENWTTFSQTIKPDENGNAKLTLMYRKDGSVNKGDDLGAIRNLEVHGEETGLITATFENDNVFTFENNFKKVEYLGANSSTLTIPGTLTTADRDGAKYYASINGLATNMAVLTIAESAPLTTSKVSVTLDKYIYVYDGTAKTPTATVMYDGTLLTKDVDYTVGYKDNDRVGTASCIITGIGSYKGTYVKTFFITSSSTADDQIVVDTTPPTISNVAGVVNGMTITISADISDPKVSDSILGSGVNAEKTKYAITSTSTAPDKTSSVWSSSNSFTVDKVSTNYLWVMAEDNLGNIAISSAVKSVMITKDLNDLKAAASLKPNSYVYDGTYHEPTVIIKDGEDSLELNTDFTVVYSNNKDVGTAKATITGKGYYTGSIELTFEITKAPASFDVNPLTVSIKPKASTTATVTYTGDGKVSVTSSDSSIASASITGNTITITGVKAGTTSVTVSVSGEKNYTSVESKVITVYVLGTPTTPTITVTNSEGKVASGNWSNKVLTITISGGDITAGPGKVGYKYSYDKEKWEVYSVPFAYTEDTNNTTIYVKAYNELETTLESSTVSYDIRLDTTAPKLGDLSATSTTNSITLSVLSIDASVSGFDKYEFYLGDDIKSTQTSKTYEYTNLTSGVTYVVGVRAWDVAGNVSNLKTISVKTDSISGVITLTPDKTEWTNTDVKVTISWPSTTLTKQIKVGDGEWTNYADTEYIIKENTTIYARLTDGVNSGSNVSLAIDNIDKVKPEVSVSSASIVFGSSITLNITDNLSKVNAWQVTDKAEVPTGNWTTITASNSTSVSYTPTKVGTFYAWAKDQAGNINDIDDSITFTVTAKDLSTSGDITAFLNETEFTYDGTAKTPSATVKDGDKPLTFGTDYTIGYTNNINAGTAIATIKGIGNYKGSIELKFTIERATSTLTLSPTSGKTFYGSQNSFSATSNVKGTIKVTSADDNYVEIVSGDDATLNAEVAGNITYKGVKATTSAVIINVSFTPEDTVNYTTASATYTVTEVSKTEPSIVANPEEVKVVVGETVDVTITNDGDGNLTVTPTDKDVADATVSGKVVTITGNEKGETEIKVTLGEDDNYGEKTITIKVTVEAKSLENSDIEASLSQMVYTYDKTEHKPTVTVKDKGRGISLTENVDYTVSYANNINAGKNAKAIITGIGNYTGTIEISFTINQASADLTLSSNDLVLAVGDSKTVTIKYEGDGELKVTPAKTTVATVALNGKTITVTGVSIGETTIEVLATEGENYLATASKEITVKVCTKPTAPTITGANENGTIASGTWTNKDLTFEIFGGSLEGAGTIGYEYSFDNVNWIDYSEVDKVTYTSETSNGKLYARAYNTLMNTLKSDATTYDIKLDKTAPTNVSVNAIATTNTITLEVTSVDGSISGVKEYEFYLGSDLKKTQESKIYTYTGLEDAKEYTLSVKVRDNAGNITEDGMAGTSVKVTTEGISEDITLTPDTKDWVNRNVIVTIEWPKTSLTKQIRIDDGEWTNYDKDNYSMAANGTIYARLSDGENHGNGVSLGIKNIDKVNPTATYNTSLVFGETLTITLADNLSGVNAWQVTESNTAPQDGWEAIAKVGDEAPKSISVTYKPTKVGSYYVWVKDEAGNINNADDNTAFTVTKKDISELINTAKLDQIEYTYDGTAKTPTATITHGDYTLKAGTDYTIDYANNTNAGENTATATIKGTGNYEGEITLRFTIKKASLNASVIMDDYVYGEKVAEPSIKDNLGKGEVTYYYSSVNSNSGGTEWKNIGPTTLAKGTYYMYAVIAETDNYNAMVTPAKSFEVTSKNLSSSDITITVTIPEGGYVYNGSEIRPEVSVKDGILVLDPNKDYTIDYANNINAGENTAKIIVTGKGNYEGVKEEYFTILRATPTIILENKDVKWTGSIITIDEAKVAGVTGGSTPNGEITYTYYLDSACTTLTSSENGAAENGSAPSVAGTYYVKATIAEKGNYTAATSNVATLRIYGAPTIPLITVKDASGNVVNAGSWATTNVTITIDGSTMLSEGDIVYEYSFDDISWITYNNTPITFENETKGTTIYARAYNSKETSMKSKNATRVLMLDKTPPTTVLISAVISDGTSYVSGWVNKDVTLTYKATDDISDISHYLYSINDGEWIKGASLKLDYTGEMNVKVKAVNNAGLESAISEKMVQIDKVLPVVESVTASGVTGRQEDITISATDAHSGIAKYALTKTDVAPVIDDVAWQSSNVFTVEENATWYAWVLDNAGNVSAQTENSKITNTHVDRTPITIEATISTNNASTLYAKAGDKVVVKMTANKNVGVLPTVTIAGKTATITPATLGEKVYEAIIIVDDETLEGLVEFSITGYEDTIGNTGVEVNGVCDESKVYVDRTLPTEDMPEATGITENKIFVQAKQNDTLSNVFNSGIAKIEYAYKKSSEDTWSNWQESNTISGLVLGTSYDIKTRATDKAGNSRESQVLTNVSTKNITKDDISLVPDTNEWVNRDVIVTIYWPETTLDKYYKINDGAWIKVDGNSTQTKVAVENYDDILYAKLTDENVNEVINSIQIKNIDKIKPTVTATVPTNWTNYAKTITVTGSDLGGSSIYGYYITQDSLYTPTFADFVENQTTLQEYQEEMGTYYIWIADNATNICENPYTIVVKNIEREKPVISFVSVDKTIVSKEDSVSIVFMAKDNNTGLTDNLSASNIEIKVGNTTITPTTKDLSAVNNGDTITYTLKLSGITGDGRLKLVIDADVVIDIAGNKNDETTLETSLIIDNTPPEKPTVKVTPEGEVVNEDVTIEIVDPKDDEDYKYSTDGGKTWEDVPEDNKIIIDKEKEGETEVIIKAVDDAGNESEETKVIVNIDITPPKLEDEEIIKPKGEDEEDKSNAKKDDEITIKIPVTDDNDVTLDEEKIKVIVGDKEKDPDSVEIIKDPETGKPTIVIKIVVDEEDEGEIKVDIEKGAITDEAGNESEEKEIDTGIKADNTRPVVSIESPEGEYKKGDEIKYVIKIEEENPYEIDNTKIKVDGGTIKEIEVRGDGTVNVIVIVGDGDGNVTITVEEGFVTDEAENKNLPVSDNTVIRDNTPPELIWATINGGDKVTEGVGVTVQVDAVGADYLLVTNENYEKSDVMNLEDLEWIPYTTETLHELTQGDGEKTVYVWAKDNAGNIAGPEAPTIILTAKVVGNNEDKVTENGEETITRTGTSVTTVKFKVTDTNFYSAVIESGMIVAFVDNAKCEDAIFENVAGEAITNGITYDTLIKNVSGDGLLSLGLNGATVKDMAGNILRTTDKPVDTEIMVDNTAPTLSVTDNSIEVEDTNLVGVTLNGKLITKTNGKVEISVPAGSIVKAIDKAGNTTTIIK